MAFMEKARQFLDKVMLGPEEEAGGQTAVTMMETGERRGFKPSAPRPDHARPQVQESVQPEMPYAPEAQERPSRMQQLWQRIRMGRSAAAQPEVMNAYTAASAPVQMEQSGFQQTGMQWGYQPQDAQPNMQSAYQQVPPQPNMQSAYQQVPPQPNMQSAYQQVPPQPNMQSAYQQVPPQPNMQSAYQQVPPQPNMQGAYQQVQQPVTQPYGYAGAQPDASSGQPQSERPQRSRRSRNEQRQEYENNLRYMDPNHFRDESGTAYTMMVQLAQPTSIAKCYRLIEFISNGETVLVNLEAVSDRAEADRCLDLLYGAAYAMNYSFTRVADRCVYLIAPREVGISSFNALNQMNQRDAAARWPGSDPSNPEDTSWQRQAAGGWSSAFGSAPEFAAAGRARGQYSRSGRYN